MREAARVRGGGGLESARSGLEPGGPLPGQARFLLALQQTAGNRAVTGLVQRRLDGPGEADSPEGTLGPVQRESAEEEELQMEPAPTPPAQLEVQPVQQALGRVQPTTQLQDGAVVQRITYLTVPAQGRTQGRVDANIAGNRITALGEIYGTVNNDVYQPAGNTKHVVKGSLTYKTRGNALIIGVISASPKRTSVGEILVFHLANLAAEQGKDFIGTDLSALEEGTPEFYRKIGLRPADDWAEMQDELVDAEEQAGKFNVGTPPENAAAKNKRRLYLHYSGELRGEVWDVIRNSQAFRNYWTA